MAHGGEGFLLLAANLGLLELTLELGKGFEGAQQLRGCGRAVDDFAEAEGGGYVDIKVLNNDFGFENGNLQLSTVL